MPARECRSDSNEIVHNADLAIYNSKLRGRNRTFAHTSNACRDFPSSDLDDASTDSAVIDINTQRTYLLKTFSIPVRMRLRLSRLSIVGLHPELGRKRDGQGDNDKE